MNRRRSRDARLFGLDPGRTRVGVGYALGTGVLATASALLGEGSVLGSVVDQFQAFVIVLAVAAIPFALAYAVWNGGPVLALAIPLAPHLFAAVAAGELSLTVDFVLALSAGAAGASLATYLTGVRSSDVPDATRQARWRPRPYPGVTDALAVATTATAFAAFAVVRVGPAVSTHATGGFVVAQALVGIALVVVLVQLGTVVRSAGA